MFSSSSNNGNKHFDPFFTNQTTPTPLYVASNIGNPNQDSSPPFLNYPEAFLGKNNDHGFLMSTHLSSHQEILGSCSNLSPRKITKKSIVVNNNPDQKKKRRKKKGDSDGDGVTAKKTVIRKRSAGKKDRHSKIHTAQGPRDRRMRLSLQIAQKFFNLQDMLGFDRASKTIEWLFSKSRASIKELKDSFQVSKQNDPMIPLSTNSGNKKEGNSNSSKICSNNLESKYKGKELRDNARARARERTKLKKMNMNMKSGLEISDNQEIISNDSRKDEEEGEEGEFSNVYSLKHQMDSFSIIEDFLGIANYNSSFGYFSNNINGVNISEGSYADPSETWNTTNNGVYNSKSSTGDINNLQVQNPNSVSTNDLIIPMNHSNGHEKNPNPVSIYEYLNY